MDETTSFEVEELHEAEVVPSLHCGPTHCHLGFTIGDDEADEAETD
jgi:hypothetical protein